VIILSTILAIVPDGKIHNGKTKTKVCNECPLRLTPGLYKKDGRERCPDEAFADCTMIDVRRNILY